jgi:omega-6 fatty acid desaturase (delta-12 desaturase)
MGRPSEKVITVEQGIYPVPDIPVKDLLSAIPYVAPMPPAFSSAEDFFLRPHCFQRSALRSSSYL